MTTGTYYGINYDYQFVDDPPEFVHASMQGRLMSMIDTREVATADGLDPVTLTFFKPPKGSRIVGGTLFNEALVSTGTLSVGTGATTYARTAVSATVPFASVNWADKTAAIADVDKFLAATTMDAATKTDLLPIAEIDTIGYEFDGETTVTVTSATAAMITAARVTLRIDLILA